MTRVYLGCAALMCGALWLGGCCKSGSSDPLEKPTPKGPTGEAAKPAKGADTTATLLSKLGAAVGCPSTTAPHRELCIAADGWATGQPAALPTDPHVFAGLVIPIDAKRRVNPAKSIQPVVLVTRNDGNATFGKILTPKPENANEKLEIAEMVMNVSILLKGRSSKALIPKGLYTFATGEAHKAAYPMVKGARGWTLRGKLSTEVRKVGSHWVAIEQDPPVGIFVNVLTDQIEPKK